MKRPDCAACVADGLLHEIYFGIWLVALLLQFIILYHQQNDNE